MCPYKYCGLFPIQLYHITPGGQAQFTRSVAVTEAAWAAAAAAATAVAAAATVATAVAAAAACSPSDGNTFTAVPQQRF